MQIKLSVIQVLLISKKLKALLEMPSELRAGGSFESSPWREGVGGGTHQWALRIKEWLLDKGTTLDLWDCNLLVYIYI